MGRLKRSTALHHLRVICERLDAVDPETFFVIPLRLYVFGSVLTDKPYVSDLDLLLAYRQRPDLDAGDIVYRLSYGKPLPADRAIQHLRRKMKNIRIGILSGTVAQWLRDHLFPPDTDVRLVWEPGFDWASVIADIEAHPARWDLEEGRRRKRQQEELRRMIREEGREAAREWFKEVSGYEAQRGRREGD